MRAFFILKNFYLQLSKSHLPFPIWCGKRDNHFSRRKTGEHGVKRLTAKKQKLVSNWCQNRKNHNFKGNKILQTIDFKWFKKK